MSADDESSEVYVCPGDYFVPMGSPEAAEKSFQWLPDRRSPILQDGHVEIPHGEASPVFRVLVVKRVFLLFGPDLEAYNIVLKNNQLRFVKGKPARNGASKRMSALLIHNVRVATPVAKENGVNWKLLDLPRAALLIENGFIKIVGPEQEVLAAASGDVERFDGCGKLLTPGLVDCHTHPVFNRTREHEFVQRLQGATYQEIAAAGGGILFSVRDLRQTSAEVLVENVRRRLDRFLMHGTTTIEAKSGYGLSCESEVRQLEVLRRAGEQHAVEVVPTFFGAHEVPPEFRSRRQAYLDVVLQEMLPAVSERQLARFADVFCEKHVFSAAESEHLLATAAGVGLRPKIHADQLSDSGGAAVAIAVGAVSADHLEHTPATLYDGMLGAGVVPVLLPGAGFFINASRYPAARDMIAAGLPVALATDFNPGTCMTESMPMVMTLACLKLRMTPAETLVAATLHAARAVALDHRIGSLEIGKQADMVLWDAEHVDTLAYHFGVNLVQRVFKFGKLVWSQEISTQA